VFPGLLIAEGGDVSYSNPEFGGAVALFLIGVIGRIGEPEADILQTLVIEMRCWIRYWWLEGRVKGVELKEGTDRGLLLLRLLLLVVELLFGGSSLFEFKSLVRTLGCKDDDTAGCDRPGIMSDNAKA
jgi:hypothetical protein